MDLLRIHFANQLCHVLDYQLQMLSNREECSQIYEGFLGVDFETANQLIHRIANALPEYIIRQNQYTDQIQNEIIDHFILFMVQERDLMLRTFGQTFNEFIHLLIFELVQNIEPNQTQPYRTH